MPSPRGTPIGRPRLTQCAPSHDLTDPPTERPLLCPCPLPVPPLPIGRVGSSDDVLAPRPRLSLRREIIAVIVPAFAEPGDDMTAYARAPRDVAAEAAEPLTRFLHGDEVVTATDDGRLILRLRHEDRGARPVRLQEMAYHAIEALDRLGFHTGVIDLGVGWAPIARKHDPETALEYADAAARESVRQRDLQPLGPTAGDAASPA